jgi:hypothetical protein
MKIVAKKLKVYIHEMNLRKINNKTSKKYDERNK